MKVVLFLYIFLSLNGTLIAQQSISRQSIYEQRFRVFGMPEAITIANPGISQTINRDLSKAQSADEAFKIINNQLKKYYNTKLRVRERLSHGVYYYTYYIGAFKEQKTNITDIKATRDFDDNTIYKLYQLKALFSDTIAVIDTFAVNIYPTDFNYRNSEYYLVPADGKAKIFLPHSGNQIVLHRGLFLDDTSSFVACNLFNGKEPSRAISFFYLKFLSREEKQELYELYQILREDTSLQESEIKRQLQAFARYELGNVSTDSIDRWLNKQTAQ